MQVLVYSLQRHHSMHSLGIRLRKTSSDVHEISANVDEVPTGDYLSAVDQIWYAGEVLSKLADCASAGLFDSSAEFIYDTHDIYLNTAITTLYPDAKTVDIHSM